MGSKNVIQYVLKFRRSIFKSKWHYNLLQFSLRIVQSMVKPGFVKTFIAAPIPYEVGDEGSGTALGIGTLNLYLCE